MVELLFFIGFSIHNIEEALWLPGWSKYARKFHKPVEKNEFVFAILIITIIGFLVTFLKILYGNQVAIIKYIYVGFVAMMIMNTIFPHLVATVGLKRYAPGLITGLFLNMPIGLYIFINEYRNGMHIVFFLIAFVGVSILVIISLNSLFRIGSRLLKSIEWEND